MAHLANIFLIYGKCISMLCSSSSRFEAHLRELACVRKFADDCEASSHGVQDTEEDYATLSINR